MRTPQNLGGRKMINSKDWLDVFPALDSMFRWNILLWLNTEAPKSFTSIQKKFGLSPGNTKHHLNKLMQAGLIVNSYVPPTNEVKDYSFYTPTPKGIEILEILLE